MGIHGLLPLMKGAIQLTNMDDLQLEATAPAVKRSIAVDSSSLLYKAAYSCATELTLGFDTDRHTEYIRRFVNTLIHRWSFIPIMVFDGAQFPPKFETHESRITLMEAKRREAAMHMLNGNDKEANKTLMQCIDTSGRVKEEVLHLLRGMNVQCIESPYEADAQCAFLSKHRLVEYVLTEDSDLLLYACERILYKLDLDSGNVQLVNKCDLLAHLNRMFTTDRGEEVLLERFRWMCILSGCDYLPSLPGIGLAKARRLVISQLKEEHSRAQVSGVERMLELMPFVLGVNAPCDYVRRFIETLSAFASHPVLDTRTGQIVQVSE